ncbi:MAG: NUDIX hydrolase [Candidatus Zixiibacteriota bacterium]
MDIPATTIESWEARYGTPVRWTHIQPVTPDNYAIIRGSQRDGRAHDITLYIAADGRIAVIAKPVYPPGMFRAPSGGLTPGESLEAGASREAYEETGLRIRLASYLLRVDVTFVEDTRRIDWCTHVFSASAIDQKIAPVDHHEIREARWALPSEFAAFGRMMRLTSHGGLHYRAALHEQVAAVHPLFLQYQSANP